MPACKQDGEPGDDGDDDGRDAEEDEHDEVWDGQQPLDEREPAVQLGGNFRVPHFEVDGLLVIGRRILVPKERKIGADARGEPEEQEIPVEPPARVLLAKDDHQERGEKEGASGRCERGSSSAPGGGSNRAPADRGRDNRDGNNREDSQAHGQPVPWALRVVDVQLERVRRLRLHAFPFVTSRGATGGFGPRSRTRQYLSGARLRNDPRGPRPVAKRPRVRGGAPTRGSAVPSEPGRATAEERETPW